MKRGRVPTLDTAKKRWCHVLPSKLARQQAEWERACLIGRAHDAGIGFVLIGEKLGIGYVRAAEIYRRHKSDEREGRRAPILDYFEQNALETVV